MIRFLALTLLLTLLLSSRAAALVAIELKPSVEIDGAYPYLSDLASIEGSEDKARHFSEVTLGRPILPGRTAQYSRMEIERWIRNAGLSAEALHWKGAGRVIVHRRSSTLGRIGVEEEVSAKIVERFGVSSSDLSVTIENWSEIQVPAGRYSLQVDIEQRRLQSDMSALLSVMSGGRLLKKLRVHLSVELKATAVVAAVSLSSNIKLDPSLLAVATVDVLSANGEVFSSPDELAGNRLIRPLSAGRPFSRRDVEPVPAVMKSRAIDVIYSSGSISIKMKGVALEDGVVGDTVMVTLPTSEAPVPVTVIGQEKGRIENGV